MGTLICFGIHTRPTFSLKHGTRLLEHLMTKTLILSHVGISTPFLLHFFHRHFEPMNFAFFSLRGMVDINIL